MAFGHSFTKLLNEKFLDKLCEVSSAYIEEHRDGLDIKLRKVRKIGEIEIIETRIKKVYVNDLPKTKVAFDVILEVELVIKEADYHYDESDTCNLWIRVPCEGDLLIHVSDWEINEEGVEQYFKKNLPSSCLSDSLVPYISSCQLEKIATEFLKEYYPSALSETKNGIPIHVDPTVLAKNLGLTIERKVIKDDSVFGQIYFEDAETDVSDLLEKGTTFIKAKTIVVNPRRFFLSNYGSENNTIIHECVHWVKHRKAFLLEKLFDSKVSRITCEAVDKAERQKTQKELQIMEWQANQLAPRIQMPIKPFRKRARNYIATLQLLNHAKYEFEVMEEVIDSLAQEFKVSRQSAKIRLVQLGFHQAIGTYTYIDGHYVRPHCFKYGFIGPSQTFSISAQKAAYERITNSELFRLTENGDYLFVENHFVYNAPLYVKNSGKGGQLELTDYALDHMDECCLVFDLKIKNIINEDYQTVCFLNRNDGDVTFEYKFNNKLQNVPKADQIAYRKKQLQENAKIRKQMTDEPEQCIQLLLKWRGKNYSDLGDAIDLNPKTISRTVKGETVPKVETIARICFGLHLPPDISQKLFDVFGCKLNFNNMEHQCIREALTYKYPEPFDVILDFLEDYGVNLKKD
mgnify:CR=1 FL=1